MPPTPRRASRFVLVLALGLVLAPALAACCGDDPVPCQELTAHVFVDTDAHELWLCEQGEQRAWFDIRLGTGGVGKKREGDGKVPLGAYTLGAPRPSAKYGTFIEIGYPTVEQRAMGYTGSAVGIHGPGRNYAWLGSVNNWFDTTDGCVGLASDAEMKRVADWVRSAKARRIVIE